MFVKLLGRAVLGTVLANVRPIQLRSLVIGVVVIALAVGGSLIGLSQAHAVADHLTVTTAAASATVTSGAAFTTQPVIAIQNSSNVTDVTVTDTVYAAVSTGATLVGAGSIAAVSGVATFTGLGVVGTVGTTYTITYHSGTLSVATQTVTVAAAGTAAKLAITTNAAGAVSGTAFATQPVVEIRDSAGNKVTSSTVTVTAIVSSGATAIGTTAVAAVSGVVTYSILGVTGTTGSTYTLTFTAGSLTVASQSLILVGASSALSIATAPAGFTSGSAFTTQPAVGVVDSSGNRITSYAAVVTATVSTGATLVGTTTATTVSGLATFSNLGISGTAGAAYVITFATSGLTSATVSVVPTVGSGSNVGVLTGASASVSGVVFATQPRVAIRDAAGNTNTSSTLVVTASVSSGGTLTGTVSVAAVAGVAAFTNLAVIGGAGTYTLTFAAPGMASATSLVNISAPEAPRLTSLSPTSGFTTGGTTISIYGSGFTGSETVTIGGVAATGVTVSSSTTIVARTPVSATTGAVTIAVSRGDSTGTLANAFVYVRTGTSLGGGVYEPPSSNPPGVRQAPMTKAAPSVSSARRVSVSVNQPTKLRMSGLPKKSTLKAQIKIGGSWKSFAKSKSTKKGQITLPPLTFTRVDTYVIRVSKGKKDYFVLVNS